MTELVLVIGNRNYSSWSLRAWLAIKQTGLPFREKIIWLDEDRDRRQRHEFSPTGRVPVLLHGDITIFCKTERREGMNTRCGDGTGFTQLFQSQQSGFPPTSVDFAYGGNTMTQPKFEYVLRRNTLAG